MPQLIINNENRVSATPIIELLSDIKSNYEAEDVFIRESLPKALPVRIGSYFFGHGFVQSEPEPEILGTMYLEGDEYIFYPNENESERLNMALAQGMVLIAETFVEEIGQIDGVTNGIASVEAFYFVMEKQVRTAIGCGWA